MGRIFCVVGHVRLRLCPCEDRVKILPFWLCQNPSLLTSGRTAVLPVLSQSDSTVPLLLEDFHTQDPDESDSDTEEPQEDDELLKQMDKTRPDGP